MASWITAAQRIRRNPEAAVRLDVIRLLRTIGPAYFRLLLGFRSVEIRHADRLVRAYRDFYGGKTRLLIAFRHPYGEEPQVLGYALALALPREARRLGQPIPRTPHAHFVYGFEVPLWGDAFQRWVLPRVGAVPVHHTKFDAASMDRIRSIMKDGSYPLALSPEGQVSYTSEDVPRLEPGAVRIGFWCAEDLAKEGRSEQTVILPVSVHYRWPPSAGKRLEGYLSRMERACGIRAAAGTAPFHRLSAIADRALALLERYYADFHGAALPGAGTRRARLEAVMEAALAAAERTLCIRRDGDVIRRVYRIRQIGWDRIFRADLGDLDRLPAVERRMADRLAAEAWLACRHMDLVDIAWYLDFDRLRPEDPLELQIETAQNYGDLVGRLQGGCFADRVGIPGKSAVLVAGEAIPIGASLDRYRGDRKATMEQMTRALELSYRECIREIREERRTAAVR